MICYLFLFVFSAIPSVSLRMEALGSILSRLSSSLKVVLQFPLSVSHLLLLTQLKSVCCLKKSTDLYRDDDKSGVYYFDWKGTIVKMH